MIVILPFYTQGELQPIERKHYLGESELSSVLNEKY